jgi:uncharacterized membrane protein
VGPCELIVARFPGNQFKGEILPEIERLVEAGTIRVIDALFALKDGDGNTVSMEVTEVDGALELVKLVEVNGAIGPDDVEDATSALEPNSSALLILFEHTWAADLAKAFYGAGGEVVMMERIPAPVVEAALEAATAEAQA